MVSGTWVWYGKGAQHEANGDIDFGVDTFKVMLTTSAYVPNIDTHDYLDDVTNEVTGSGYTAGGATVTGMAVSFDAASDQVRIDFNDPAWTGLTVTGIRNAILYKSRGGASSADELVAYCPGDGNVDVSGGDFSVTIHVNGALYKDVTPA